MLDLDVSSQEICNYKLLWQSAWIINNGQDVMLTELHVLWTHIPIVNLVQTLDKCVSVEALLLLGPQLYGIRDYL